MGRIRKVEGNSEAGSDAGKDRREAQRDRLMGRNLQLLGVGEISWKSQRLGKGKLPLINAGELS